ncbi:hypothetical protein ACFQ9X_29240 [Catenulispora yoronensis]
MRGHGHRGLQPHTTPEQSVAQERLRRITDFALANAGIGRFSRQRRQDAATASSW